ncbi:MAG TPA: hypothetical protein DD435_03060 [Cyanobacteria bacterium UBA8530]|nr:hypothetical protein [Cyanobacteria bacterium UBA8530]
MTRIAFVGFALLIVLLPFFLMNQGGGSRSRYHGGWFFHGYSMGTGDYRSGGAGFRGGGPGSFGK